MLNASWHADVFTCLIDACYTEAENQRKLHGQRAFKETTRQRVNTFIYVKHSVIQWLSINIWQVILISIQRDQYKGRTNY